MRAWAVATLAVGPWVGFAACAYPDFQFGTSSSGTGGQGTTGTGGQDASSSGTGGAASSSSSSSSAASSSSSGMPCTITHAAGSECEYLPGLECGCQAGFKCSIANEATGATKCIPFAAGPESKYAKCGDDGSCDKGLWCDYGTSVCKPICTGNNNCNGGLCLPASNGAMGTIPDLKVCTVYCDPKDTMACGAGATCTYRPLVAELDCIWTENLGEGVDCMYANSCAPGLVCVGTCERWCSPANGFPNLGCTFSRPLCVQLAMNVTYNNTAYGFCSP